MVVVVLPGVIGQAPALEMAYASYQKFSRALAAVAHALARGCEVSESLVREAEFLRSFPLAETAQFPGVANHSWTTRGYLTSSQSLRRCSSDGQRPRITTIRTWPLSWTCSVSIRPATRPDVGCTGGPGER